MGAIAIVAFVAGLAFVALPLIASSRIVQDRIALELSSLTGYQVDMESPLRIEVWPDFRAMLTGVKLIRPDTSGQPPAIDSKSMEIELSAMAALRGRVEFSSVHLIGPTFRLEPGAKAAPWLPGDGRIARSIAEARRVLNGNADSPDQGGSVSDRLATIEISDGRVVASHSGVDEAVVTGLSGKLDWPELTQAASLTATGVWRGETVRVEAASRTPLALFAGGAAPVSISLTSALATASFEGEVKSLGNAYADGKTNISAPSLPRLATWLGTDMLPGASVGSASFAGELIADARRIRVENVELGIDDNLGAGVLNLSLSEKPPVLSGSLAFETLDLPSLLSAVTPLAIVDDPGMVALSSQADLDLRLSAERAVAGSITLSEVAAAIQLKDGLAVLDISDSAAFGGRVQAGIRFDRKPQQATVEMRMLASDIDGGAFGAAANLTRLVPIGRGTISVILKGPGTGWKKMLGDATGSISANFGKGALSGFDLAGFLARNRQGGIFPLSEVSKGTLPIGSAEFKASVSNGMVKINTAEATTEGRKLWLSGTASHIEGELALSGGVASLPDKTGKPDGKTEAAFLVGGPLSAPLISPVAPAPAAE
ncbi:MAG: AsmA family protein [Pseudaminobacter sp.]|nr:AsmA family protein [Pseudaminobacter sp.]